MGIEIAVFFLSGRILEIDLSLFLESRSPSFQCRNRKWLGSVLVVENDFISALEIEIG